METVGRVLGVIGAFVGVVVVIAAIVLGGWWLGWWFKEQNVEKQSHIFRQSYANQERLREDISTKIGDVREIEVEISELHYGDSQVAPLEAQKRAILNIVCHDAEQVSGDGLPPDQSSYIDQSCLQGSAR